MPDLNLPEERRHVVLNEMTATVGSVFLGMQFGCAACHDHKFDPIRQHDFYRLRTFFESTDIFRDHPVPTAEEIAARERAEAERPPEHREREARRKELEDLARQTFKEKNPDVLPTLVQALDAHAELVESLEPQFDFAVVEECVRYDECDAFEPFVRAGKAVFHVEYEGAMARIDTPPLTYTDDSNNSFLSDLVPSEANLTVGHMLDNDPRPHFVHQSNFADQKLAFNWLNKTLTDYHAVVADNMSIINPTMTQAARVLTQQASWDQIKGGVSAYIKGGQVVVTTPSAGWVPLTAATGLQTGTQTPWGESYAGTRSAWTYLNAGETLTVDVAANALPTASFTVTGCPALSLTCSFDGTASKDTDGTVMSYTWDFGDGTAPQATTTPTVTHSFAKANTYKVTLRVTDNRGGVSPASPAQDARPTGTNQLPIAVATAACTALSCTFDGTKSSDPDGSIASYSWSFGDNTSGAGATPTHQYPSGGTYTATLTVTDDKGAIATATVTVGPVAPNKPPVASFTVVCSGLACAVDAGGSGDPDGSVVSYQWTFGDDTAASGVKPDSHSFALAGSYTIALNVFDDKGASASSSQTVAVQPSAIVKAKAVSRSGKLKVDVDPNQKGSKYWKFNVQKQDRDGSWSTLKKAYKTQGKKETRTINLKKGIYRVIVQPKFGYSSGYSAAVLLRK